jgi:hypothetical protein
MATNIDKIAVDNTQALVAVMEAVKQHHDTDTWHHGKFAFCLTQPCRGALKAYPDFIPADERPDWLPGATSLARHETNTKG